MSITLTATEQSALTALHGANTLKRATNPEGAATSVNWTTAGFGVEACIAAFSRRGYTLGQDNIEVLYFAILWITPRPIWSPELKAMNDEWEQKYPQRWPVVVGSGDDEDVNDRKAFTQDNLDRLDKIRRRPGFDQPRGNV